MEVITSVVWKTEKCCFLQWTSPQRQHVWHQNSLWIFHSTLQLGRPEHFCGWWPWHSRMDNIHWQPGTLSFPDWLQCFSTPAASMLTFVPCWTAGWMFSSSRCPGSGRESSLDWAGVAAVVSCLHAECWNDISSSHTDRKQQAGEKENTTESISLSAKGTVHAQNPGCYKVSVNDSFGSTYLNFYCISIN